MQTLICKNKECPKYNETLAISSFKTYWNELEKKMDHLYFCEDCKEKLSLIKKEINLKNINMINSSAILFGGSHKDSMY